MMSSERPLARFSKPLARVEASSSRICDRLKMEAVQSNQKSGGVSCLQ